MAAFPPPVCRPRASCIRERSPVDVVVHGIGGLPVVRLVQPAPVITSGALRWFGV